MSKEQTEDLLRFLEPFGAEVTDLVMWLRELVWDRYPETNELIYDNYNALAFGWSVTERLGQSFCSVAVGRSSKNVHFGFYWGSRLSDPEQMLLGTGNQYRYILVKDKESFPKTYITTLIKEAHANALAKVKPKELVVTGQTIVRSISEKRRPQKQR
jgi:hypothetical protein